MNDYITRAELQRMVDACDPTTLAGKRDRLLLVVLRALGGRSGEACGLTVDDAEVTTGTESGGLVLRVCGEILEVPPGEVTSHEPADLFIAWYAALPWTTARDNPPLFRAITKDDRLRGQDGIAPWSINQIVKRAAARAGLDNPERYAARIMRGPTRRKA